EVQHANAGEGSGLIGSNTHAASGSPLPALGGERSSEARVRGKGNHGRRRLPFPLTPAPSPRRAGGGRSHFFAAWFSSASRPSRYFSTSALLRMRNLLKSGLRLSRNACMPSSDSSEPQISARNSMPCCQDE